VSESPDRRPGAFDRRQGSAERRSQTMLDRREWLNQLDGRWDHGLLPSNIQVGRDCFLEATGSFATFKSRLDPGLVLGDRVAVYGWTKFTISGQAYLEVGDDSVLVGPHFMSNNRITIGKRVVIGYHVLMADWDMHPIDPDLRRIEAEAMAPLGHPEQVRQPVELGTITIGDDVCIGAGTMILKDATIGDGARVHAGSVVTSNVPPGVVVAGSPARVVGDPA
jgi:acetyltransferase-like isoleucine patch superfamily enzyme